MNSIKLIGILFLLIISLSSYGQQRRGSQVRFVETEKQQNSLYTPERKLEIGLISAYQWGGKFYSYRFGELKITDGTSYGISLSFPLKWHSRIELSFLDQITSISYRDGLRYEHINTDIRYYQVGVIKELPKGKMVPYGAFSLGAVQADATESRKEEWNFAITLGGGIKYYINDHIGIKIESRMLAPISFGGLYFSIGSGGTGTGVEAGATTLQGYIGGGLTFSLVK
ncbi:MAG: hypothetical protein ABFR62_08920 [Bacteroidota bacterium]